MDPRFQNTHVKLLSFDLLSQSSPISFLIRPNFLLPQRSLTLTRRDSRRRYLTRANPKPDKFLKFTIDDGTGCIICVLWLNQLTSPYFFRRSPPTVRLIAGELRNFASEVKIGEVARVRGRITSYRGAVQITVSDVVVERDPNAEILHWLECLRLARHCCNVLGQRN